MINKIISTIITLPIIGLLFLFGQILLMEGYNFFFPYIDTEFSEKYTPEIFDKVKFYHNKSDVESLIGKPLFVFTDTIKHQITYSYTSDGYFNRKHKNNSSISGDFAWYRSSVTFDKQERIIRIDKGWSFD